MKSFFLRFFICISILLATTGCISRDTTLSSFQLSDELVITEIRRDIFLVTHSFPWPGNSLIVLMDNEHILWIDTPYTPEATAQVIDWIHERFPDHTTIAEINTGFHIDNLGGNEELIRRNIPVYGSDLTVELLATRSEATMATLRSWLTGSEYEKYRKPYSGFTFHAPTRTFNIQQEQTITLGSEKAVIYYPGPSHTYDNVVVFIPGKKLLFGGCILLSESATKVGYSGDGNLDEWAKAITNLEKRFPDTDLAVPGHGEPGDYRLLAHTRKLVDAARTR